MDIDYILSDNKMRKLFKSVLKQPVFLWALLIKFWPFSPCVGNSETETEKQRMAVCGLPLHLGGSESRTTLEQKFIFQIGTLSPYDINERFSFTFDSANFKIGSCLSVRSWRHEARERFREHKICVRLALRLAESNYRFLSYKT